MPLNYPALYMSIYAAFQKQALKPGPNKAATTRELASDISRAIDLYVRSGTVQTAVMGLGVGATVPHPMVVPVFTVTAGTGIGVVV